MRSGSIRAASALAICGLAGNTTMFLAGTILVVLTSAFVLYSTAFAFLVQTTGSRAQRSISYLTLIAGFVSTIFWLLTSWMLGSLEWHQVYFVFATLNLAVSLPLHLWLSRFARIAAARPVEAVATQTPMSIDDQSFVFILIVLGFSLAGFVSAATLFHMVPPPLLSSSA